jgi:head-tail adaptor
MQAGRLRERVTIEAETRVPNGQGGYATDWAPLPTAPTVWAEVIGLNGGEGIRAGVERSVSRVPRQHAHAE